MKHSAILLLGLFTCAATSVFAHPGPRIWVSIDGGQITTYAGPYPPSAPGNYAPATIFSQALGDEGDDVWFSEFPGYQIVPGGSIPTGTTFSYNITGPLLWYNAGDASTCAFFETVGEHFDPTPPAPQMAVTNELFQTRVTGPGFVAGHATFTYHGSAGDHNHLTYTLLGDGAGAGGGSDGIYALGLQLTAPGFSASETFFLILSKNASGGDVADAVEVLTTPRAAHDLDCDGDIDIDDYSQFEQCIAGPATAVPTGSGLEHCLRADFNNDGHVDLRDFGLLQLAFGA